LFTYAYKNKGYNDSVRVVGQGKTTYILKIYLFLTCFFSSLLLMAYLYVNIWIVPRGNDLKICFWVIRKDLSEDM